jgi:hypothetical protein
MSVSRASFRLIAASVLLAVVPFAGCGSAKNMDCSSVEGRRTIVSEVDTALSDQDCAGALSIIEQYYPLEGCDTDEIRLARASANACAANVNFFQLISDLGSNSIVGSELWVTMTKLFPSNLSDQRVTGAQNSLDALFAIRKPGAISPAQYMINTTTRHPGTLVAAHRTQDSNIYAMLVSMAAIGALQNRYGSPKGNWHKSQKLGQTVGNANGWEDPTFVDVNACTYAGAVVTLFDSIAQVGPVLNGVGGGSVGTALVTAANTYSALLDAACDAGCVSCGMAVGSCTPCPVTLRDRNSCTGLVTDKNSCAAAGIADFIDNNALGWPN